MNEEKYVIFIEHEHEKEKLFPTLMEINPTKICNFRIKSETYKWVSEQNNITCNEAYENKVTKTCGQSGFPWFLYSRG
jgi:hypothetical protein